LIFSFFGVGFPERQLLSQCTREVPEREKTTIVQDPMYQAIASKFSKANNGTEHAARRDEEGTDQPGKGAVV
jgi:hypothetical protein